MPLKVDLVRSIKMNQEEISLQLWELLIRYEWRTGNEALVLWALINDILGRRGISLGSPMKATAQLLVARDILRIWEGA